MRKKVLSLVSLLCVAGTASMAISQRGFLRVGVSNDYPPFSTLGGGVSRELATLLAADLGFAGPLFVDFDWPDLHEGIESGAFDIALSGITWRADRAAKGWMSLSLGWGGPCLLARSQWPPREGGEVSVAVNQGGFLERWARETLLPRLEQASKVQLRTVTKNLSLPTLLRQGEVEAVVTDSYEVTQFATEVPGSSRHCEPPAERKVLWLAPSQIDLAPEIEGWILENRGQFVRLLANTEPKEEFEVSDAAVTAWNDVLDLVARRLAYMPEVGRFKLDRGIAVEDLEREALVLEDSKIQSQALGLDPDWAVDLFQFLMNWAKEIQVQQPADVASLDLRSEVRPALLELSQRILGALDRAAELGGDLPPTESLRLEVLRRYDSGNKAVELLELLREIEN